jgi:hypothetical protein
MKIWNIQTKRIDGDIYVRLGDVLKIINKVYRMMPSRSVLFLLNLFKGGG